MVVTTRIRLDRTASSTKNTALAAEVIVGDQIVAAEGYVLAVRILTDKSTYNEVENLSVSWARDRLRVRNGVAVEHIEDIELQ